MKSFITMVIVALCAALGVYFAANERGFERAYFVYFGVAFGFYFRHCIYEK